MCGNDRVERAEPLTHTFDNRAPNLVTSTELNKTNFALIYVGYLSSHGLLSESSVRVMVLHLGHTCVTLSVTFELFFLTFLRLFC